MSNQQLKQFELQDKGNATFKFTVTPDRISIKVQKDTSVEERLRVTNFLNWVAYQPEMLECTVAFRGKLKIRPNKPLYIQMSNEHATVTHYFTELATDMYSIKELDCNKERNMEPIQILAIEDVLNAAAHAPKNGLCVVDGVQFAKGSILSVILKYGTICSCCGAEALYFVSEPHPANAVLPIAMTSLRLMFEHTAFDGSYAYMTKDHIIPKHHNGPNAMDNYQPMCNVCNLKKGHEFDHTNIPARLSGYLTKEGKVAQPYVPLTTNPNINPYLFLVYTAYIRWNTIIQHKQSKTTQWNSNVRLVIMAELKKIDPTFDEVTFHAAFKKLAKEVKAQPTTNLKRQTLCPHKPATYFRLANQSTNHTILTTKLKSTLKR